jgi:fructose-bisphosphate aldolase class I
MEEQLKTQILSDTVNALFAGSRGLLAIDESTGTCDKRFAPLGIAQNPEIRRDWRELIVMTPGLVTCISGIILYDETIRQNKRDGTPIIKAVINAGIIPGIKVDMGAKSLACHPGEKVTEGLDGLRERLAEYFQMGARFAKWRAVIAIDKGIPSVACIEVNASALARYAALCQEVGLVPIIEPEVLMEGYHGLQQCSEVTEQVQRAVFDQLYIQGVALEYTILKPNMVISGLSSPVQASVDEVADATIKCLRRSAPAALAGIAFLSGGQSGPLATAHLNAMHVTYSTKLPWPLTFSFARAIQQPALQIWGGKDENIKAAQRAIFHRAKCDQAARLGKYNIAMEENEHIFV